MKHKTYNEYGDRLVSKDVAMDASLLAGYDVYGPECFTVDVEKSKGEVAIFDNWSGLIPDDQRFLCYRPTQSSLQSWLRDVNDIHVYVNHYEFVVEGSDGYYFHISKSVRHSNTMYEGKFETYEEALEEGLQKAIKLVKDKNK